MNTTITTSPLELERRFRLAIGFVLFAPVPWGRP